MYILYFCVREYIDCHRYIYINIRMNEKCKMIGRHAYSWGIEERVEMSHTM